ncbi:hypothetical protein CCACVL1_04653 [Corchorus capsularis]|uniref:Uncharacterized protein n=1 Tax=Corchorus capsularis TaxID=210143 RepID=A0A1R3JQE9_COCAP|nr:hypothetical protein CCACVL1_04653 [Corchorus capsularis]
MEILVLVLGLGYAMWSITGRLGERKPLERKPPLKALLYQPPPCLACILLFVAFGLYLCSSIHVAIAIVGKLSADSTFFKMTSEEFGCGAGSVSLVVCQEFDSYATNSTGELQTVCLACQAKLASSRGTLLEEEVGYSSSSLSVIEKRRLCRIVAAWRKENRGGRRQVSRC